MCSHIFSCQGVINHLTCLLVELNLVNGVNIPRQNLKVYFPIACWCFWLLDCKFHKWHLHFSYFDVKRWHQPTFICWCLFEVMSINFSLQILISQLNFFISILDIIFFIHWPGEWRNPNTDLSLNKSSVWCFGLYVSP